MKLNDLIEPGDPEIIASGFEFIEGPIWIPEGALLFSDIPANRIYRWTSEEGIMVWREPSNHANGLTLDKQNRLVICEHGNRRVSRIDPAIRMRGTSTRPSAPARSTNRELVRRSRP